MSQFSYELDERQIRIMLQNAEVDYNEALWPQFQSTARVEPVKVTPVVPKFNLGLSRQVLVPAFFVLLIGALSALLFSFVDFKKKEILVPEKMMQDQFPPMTANEDKREIVPPQKTTTPTEPVAKKDSSNLAVKEEHHTTAPVAAQAVQQVQVNTPSETKDVKKVVVNPATVKEVPVRKRRRKKIEAIEDLPSINAPTTLTSENPEPEPDLKLN